MAVNRTIRMPVAAPIKGRGSASHVAGRFEKILHEGEDDGWGSLYDDLPHADASGRLAADTITTTVTEERARTVISRNNSPDIGFSQSVNPYRGCEHGCVYCFARPSHAYLDLSPGLDFETRLFAKTNAAQCLRQELARKGYVPDTITLGINTDAYQPIERRYRVTRACLEVLAECGHPVAFVTKSALIARDLDLLVPMAQRNLVSVHVSVTTLDNRLSSQLEPRAAAPHARLQTIRMLTEAGIPVGVLVAPVIPMVTDAELERILVAAREAGAQSAGYVLLRLPHELKQVWREWLDLHLPDRAAHVMSLIQQMRGGKDYDSAFGTRMRGTGPFAQLLATRFTKASTRCGYTRLPALDTSQFIAPRVTSAQGELF